MLQVLEVGVTVVVLIAVIIWGGHQFWSQTNRFTTKQLLVTLIFAAIDIAILFYLLGKWY